MTAPRRCTQLYTVIARVFFLSLSHFTCFLHVISISLCLFSSSLAFAGSVSLSLTLTLALSHSLLLSLAVFPSVMLSIVLPCSFTCSLSLSGPLLSLASRTFSLSPPVFLCIFCIYIYESRQVGKSYGSEDGPRVISNEKLSEWCIINIQS